MTTIKSIKLTSKQWAKLYNQLVKDNPPSVILIREKMRKVLGFTSRHHSERTIDSAGYPDYVDCYFLDFFDEKKKTYFLLRYGDYLNDN